MLERSREAATTARRVAPNDSRAANLLFDVAVRDGDWEAASSIVEEMRALDPGSVEVLRCEALIARRSGEPERALALMRDVVKRRPAREYLSLLAEFEYEQGLNDDATRTLEALLERFPGNNYGRSKLAEVELLYGSAERAEDLYMELVEETQGEIEISNLGLAQSLLGKYDEAAANFLRAAEMAPAEAGNFLNLADCHQMAGDSVAADSLYRHVLVLLESAELPDLSVRAQCYAHIGRAADAVALMQDLLQQDPGNAWYYYAASLVYATVGQQTSALVNARKASDLGVSGRWFSLGLFSGLQEDPEFARIVAMDPVVGN